MDADPTTTAALKDAQRKFDAASVAFHRMHCAGCLSNQPCPGPTAQDCADVEVILDAYDAG